MYPRSLKFDVAYSDSHTVSHKAEVWSTAGIKQAEFDILDGTITVDDVAVRRTANLDLTDTTGTLVPDDMTDLLSPRYFEVHLFKGIKFVDGTEERLPVGVFSITDHQIDDSGAGLHIALALSDRAYRVSKDLLQADYTILEGSNYKEAILSLVNPSVPFAAKDLVDNTAFTTPMIAYEVGDDRWKAAQDLATAVGQELYFGPDGTLLSRFIPDYSLVEPVWNFVEGETATMLYINRRLTEQDSVNNVIVIGEASGGAAPVRGQVLDDNPLSPTYVSGPWGNVVLVERSTNITTDTAAYQMAFGLFQKRLGVSDLVRLNAIAHPAFEIGDVVTIERAASKVSGRYVIDKISIPMTAVRPMDVSMRKRVL
jgi:hypothetical protein